MYFNDTRGVSFDLKVDPMMGAPKEIIPEGMTHERQTYLNNEIRQFCIPSIRDAVCPKPSDPAQPPTKKSKQ